jgi:hypothetical protein
VHATYIDVTSIGALARDQQRQTRGIQLNPEGRLWDVPCGATTKDILLIARLRYRQPTSELMLP